MWRRKPSLLYPLHLYYSGCLSGGGQLKLTLGRRFLCRDYDTGYVSNDQPRHYTYFYKTPQLAKRCNSEFQGTKSSTNLTMFISLHNTMPVCVWFRDFLRTPPNVHPKPFLGYPDECLGYSPSPWCEYDSLPASLHLALANHLHVTSQVCPSYGPKERSSLVSAIDPTPYWRPGHLSTYFRFHTSGYFIDHARLAFYYTTSILDLTVIMMILYLV